MLKKFWIEESNESKNSLDQDYGVIDWLVPDASDRQVDSACSSMIIKEATTKE